MLGIKATNINYLISNEMDFNDYLNEVPERNNQEQRLKAKAKWANKQFAKTKEVKEKKPPRDTTPVFQPVDGVPDVRNGRNAVSGNAKGVLKAFITRTPYYKTIEEQLNILKAEILVYKGIGDVENYQKSSELIKMLSVQKQDISKRFTNEFAPINKVAKSKAPVASDILTELRLKQKSIMERIKEINPNTLAYKLRIVRRAMKIDGRGTLAAAKSGSKLDFDSFASQQKTTSMIEHESICTKIAMTLNMTVSEVKQTKTGVLKEMLSKAADTDAIKQLKAELADLKIDISAETARIAGPDDISNIMFNTFDYETVSEELPKNVLAASYVEYVKSIAYKKCKNLGRMDLMDDAIGYGLLGLSIAVDTWYSTQRLKTERPLSFETYSYKRIVCTIDDGLWEMSSNLTKPKTSADLKHAHDREVREFKLNNPELTDMSPDMVDLIVNATPGITKKAEKTTAESDIVGIYGDDVDEGDVWSSITRDSSDDAGNSAGYDALLFSIKSLFNLFEQPSNKAAKNDQFKKKLFNKFDYKLFKMWLGIERNTTNPLKTKNYSYEEMGKILSDYYAQNGDLNHTFSAPAIKDRLDKMAKKIKKVFELYPAIREGFEYLLNVSHMETTSELAEDMQKISIKQQYVQTIPLKEQQYMYRQGALD